MKGYFSLMVLIFLLACDNSAETVPHSTKEPDLPLIVIQPLGDFDEELSRQIGDDIVKYYPMVRIHKNIPILKSAFYKERQRYRADSLIRWLSSKATNEIYVGLCKPDISTTKGIHQDWGVMGLGYSPGKACIASTFRLNKKDLRTQLFKVAIHELGHTQGLPHCINEACFMQDAEGKNKTEQLTGFCGICANHLRGKGWKM